jgi:hypothetical protein
MERAHLEDLGISGRIILKCIIKNRMERCGLDSSDSGQGHIASSCEHGDKHFGSINSEEFFDFPSPCSFLKKLYFMDLEWEQQVFEK